MAPKDFPQVISFDTFYKKFEKQQTATLETLSLGPKCRTSLMNARESQTV
jgi:hypothetical protein